MMINIAMENRKIETLYQVIICLDDVISTKNMHQRFTYSLYIEGLLSLFEYLFKSLNTFNQWTSMFLIRFGSEMFLMITILFS
jgi:hypothetical protein